ncbi:hypothetical protein [Variovorax sp. 350MFTsu5.1]|uniref:hypothetical protein n=1 Tax=Variovorax sp. 350MFTsu5.1 TaxID=3158365 RepID=UPI003AAC253A
MSETLSWAQAGAVIAACWAIISGIGAWKREFIGKRQIELAELVLAKFYECRDAIADIRSPFGFGGEGNTRERGENENQEESRILDQAFVAIERYRKREIVFTEFEALKYRFMASFGSEYQPIFGKTIGAAGLILHSSRMLGNHYWKRQGRVPMTQQEFDRHLAEMRRHERIFWDDDEAGDEIRTMLAAAEKQLGEAVAPCFREPMSTYAFLTTPLRRFGKKPPISSKPPPVSPTNGTGQE